MPDYTYESQFSEQRVMGIDEVGYGAWAGPVGVGAVYLDIASLDPEDLAHIDDSKKLSSKKRAQVARFLQSKEGVSIFSYIHLISSQQIDHLGIKQATLMGMTQAIQGLMDKYPSMAWGGVLVDGLSAPKSLLPVQCIVKGDQKSLSIAAASILVKEARDELMRGLSEKYPMYGWDSNVGYGTKDHRMGIQEYGCCSYHRFSYKPLQTYKPMDTKEVG